jgi:uncharacterized protein (DUF433 family)
MLLTAAADSYLAKVEFSDNGEAGGGEARRFWPAGKASPVVFDPEIGFGAATVRGIRTEAIAELVDAGEPMDEVAQDFQLSLGQVKAALSYEWSDSAAA